MAKRTNIFKEAFNRALLLIEVGSPLPTVQDFCTNLDVSRTTVRAITQRMVETGLIEWTSVSKRQLRPVEPSDEFPESETSSLASVIEREFMFRLINRDVKAGQYINELEFSRELGVATTSVREFLIKFSRFGLIEKRPNSRWILKGFDHAFASELHDIREMFELRSALAFLSIPRGTAAWHKLDFMEHQHHEMALVPDLQYSEYSNLDERFHRLIHTASDNRFVMDFYDVIAMVCHYHYLWDKTDEHIRNSEAIQEHLDYIAALKSGNRDKVEKACRHHLKSAKRNLLAAIST